MKIKNIEKIKEQLSTVMDNSTHGLAPSGFEIQETDFNLDMKDDYYHYDDRRICLAGERKKKVYKIGTKVKVRCIDTNNVCCFFSFPFTRHSYNI